MSSTRHPDVKDMGYRNGVGGILTPADYLAATSDALHEASERVIRAQRVRIAELEREVAVLRRMVRE